MIINKKQDQELKPVLDNNMACLPVSSNENGKPKNKHKHLVHHTVEMLGVKTLSQE